MDGTLSATIMKERMMNERGRLYGCWISHSGRFMFQESYGGNTFAVSISCNSAADGEWNINLSNITAHYGIRLLAARTFDGFSGRLCARVDGGHSIDTKIQVYDFGGQAVNRRTV